MGIAMIAVFAATMVTVIIDSNKSNGVYTYIGNAQEISIPKCNTTN